MKLVSVVVATYRRDKDLRRALESLANQSCSNMEIVLVDDNADSEWNSKILEIVNDFKEKFSEISLNYIVNNPNQGSAKTRNIGIEASNGEYVTFLDDDDLYLSEKVEKQVEFMINGGYDFSITDLALYNENGKEIDRRIRSYIKDTAPESLFAYHFKFHMTGTDTMMFKKEYLVKIGGFAPIDVGDEFYLMQRAIEGGGKFGYLPRCDIKAYVHTGENGGVSSGEGKIQGERALFEHKKQYFDRIDRKSQRFIKMRYYAVIAFAYLRMGKRLKFLKSAFKSFFISPIGCLNILIRR